MSVAHRYRCVSVIRLEAWSRRLDSDSTGQADIVSADVVTPTYTDQLYDVTPAALRGFLVGWPDPRSPETHARLLHSSFAAIVAMHERLADLYMVDLLCDDDVAPFYERVGGFTRAGGFIHRNYAMQSGASLDA